MEAKTKVKIESLAPYRHLFPAAQVVDKTVKLGATVSDTVDFIPQIVHATLWQVERYVEQELRGLSDYAACEKLWHFVKVHIRYERDKRGKEQVRSPRRLIHDAKGDCDCMTTFVSACLTAKKIDGEIILRITKYEEDFFQHIYPVVILRNGQQIIIDCVADAFNYEVPYTEKKDFKMDLQYLDGIEEEKTFAGNVDAQDLFGWDEFGDLGRRSKKRSHNSSAMPEANQGGKKGKKGFQKFKKIAKRVLNVTNKANPATALLRAGILASMKLNIFKVAQKLKWAYLSENEAKAKGADMGKFGKLKNVLYKIEQIFYTAGGKPENLKKAILSGRGNRNKEVSGFGLIDSRDIELSGYDNYTPMPQLLGDLYHDEFVNGVEGLGELGIATEAAIASATTVMGTIAALLKSIGNLFPKKQSNDFTEDAGSGDGSNSNSGGSDDNSQPTVTTASRNSNSGGGGGGGGGSDSGSETPATTNESSSTPTEQNDNSSNTQGREMQKSGDEGSEDGNTNGTAKEKSDAGSDDTQEKGFKAFWDKNKKWMKPVGIGLGVAAVLYGGYRIIKSNKDKNKKAPTSNGQAALNGYSRHKHKQKKSKRKNGGGSKKSSIALM